MSNSRKRVKFSHLQKLSNQPVLNGARMIKRKKTSTVAFMKLTCCVVLFKEKQVNWKKKTKDNENLFFKLLLASFA